MKRMWNSCEIPQNSIKDVLDNDKKCMRKCKYCKQIVGMDCLELNLIERGRIT